MVTLVPVVDPDGEQRELFDAWSEVYATAGRRVLGDSQTAWTAQEQRAMWADPDSRRTGWAALEDGVVVGAARLTMPQRDNLTLGLVDLAVHPDHWRRGIGTRLLHELERWAAREGRTVLLAETTWPAGGRDESGEGFAARFGYAAAQTVLRSTLHLPADRDRLAAVVGDPAADGYVIETRVGGIPEEWLEGRAELSRRMSTDTPFGDVQLAEQDWDAGRVRREYETVAAAGRRTVETFAVERATGRLVGYTHIQVPVTDPSVCYQHDTLVLREHRGHRLGLRMKAANALALMDEVPGSTAVRTWNADDNEPMLAVNRALGWVPDAHLGEWQKVLSVVRSIHIAPATKLPARSVAVVEAEEGRGLVGDRYHGSRHRHVTVQALPDLEAAAADLGADVPPGSTRRNVTLSAGPVPTRPGARIRIGDVDLEVVRIAAPCRLMDDLIAPGAREALHLRAGSVFRLLGSGTIRVGDLVDLDPDRAAAGH